MPEIDDEAFGRTAVRLGFCTRNQIRRCRALLEKEPGSPALWGILLRERLITKGERDRVLAEMEGRATVAAAPAPEAPSDFCRQAVERGLVTPEQLQEAVEIRAVMAAEGIQMLVEDVLIQKGRLSREEIKRILGEMGVGALKERDLIPGYEIEERLGRGAMGAVYRARQLSIGRTVAIKVLDKSRTENEVYVARFFRESKAVARLNHENIVRAIDAGNVGETYYFVMEFVDGVSAEDLLRKRGGPLPEEEVIEIGAQMARALGHASAHGLLHRDIKPDNIMVTEAGVAKLCDLGLAKITDEEGVDLTKTGMTMGTASYISPEQARGERDLDVRSDLYSLGAALFHLATGRVPYEASGIGRIIYEIMTQPAPEPREFNPGISEGLRRVILCLMQKDPADRFQRPSDLEKALEALRTGSGKLPAASVPPGKAPTRSAPTAAPAPTGARERPAPKRETRRLRIDTARRRKARRRRDRS